jgi:hypothetical protein
LVLAQEAAAAWGAGMDTAGFFCTNGPDSGTCLHRMSSSQNATWCYTGTLAGHGALNTAGTSPLCPGAGTTFTWY